MAKEKKYAEILEECVACGCCVKVCPRQALHIERGITARVNSGRCVGCAKCVGICPAGVIELRERGARCEEAVV